MNKPCTLAATIYFLDKTGDSLAGGKIPREMGLGLTNVDQGVPMEKVTGNPEFFVLPNVPYMISIVPLFCKCTAVSMPKLLDRLLFLKYFFLFLGSNTQA